MTETFCRATKTNLLSGCGRPIDSIGRKGDFYEDTCNNNLYGPKTTTWQNTLLTLPGIAGLPGPRGSAGNNGSAGNDGSQGSDSGDSNTILYGENVPDSITGEDGDFYFQINNDNQAFLIYGPKINGAWGPGTSLQGIQGESGSDGSDGSQILSGIAPPSSDSGNNGDYYIELGVESITVYGPKSGDWGTGILVKGGEGSCSDCSCSCEVFEYVQGDLTNYSTYTPINVTIEEIIVSDTGDTIVLFASNPIIYISTDSGTTWRQMRLNENNNYTFNSASISSSGQYIMVSYTNGSESLVYMSEDFGESFHVPQYLVEQNPIVSVIDNYSGRPLYTYVDYSGTTYNLKLSNGWNFWFDKTITFAGVDGDVIDYSLTPAADMFLISQNGNDANFYISSDLGDTWLLQSTIVNDNVKAFAIDSSGNRVTVISDIVIYISSDSGISFTQITNIPDTINSLTRVTMTSNGVHQFVIANTGTSLQDVVYFSSDSGLNWQQYAPFAPTTLTNSISIAVSGSGNRVLTSFKNQEILMESGISDPALPVFITSDFQFQGWIAVDMSWDGKYRIATTRYGLYVSDDYGETWVGRFNYDGFISTGRDVAVDRTGQYMVAIDNGIIISYDYGMTWSVLASNGDIGTDPIKLDIAANAVILNPTDLMVVAVDFIDKIIHIQKDGTVRPSVFLLTPSDVSISATGQYVTAVSSDGDDPRKINVSSNFGTSYTFIILSSSIEFFTVSISASGQHQLVSGTTTYRSNDYGVTWLEEAGLRTLQRSYANVVSQTGQYQYVVLPNNNPDKFVFYKSSNFGSNWDIVYELYDAVIPPSFSSITISAGDEHLSFTGLNSYGIYKSSKAIIMDSFVPREDLRADIGLYNRAYRNVYAENLYLSTAPIITSDIRLKEDIKDIKIGSAFVKDLRAVEYHFRNDLNTVHYGIIAQEAHNVLKKHNERNTALCDDTHEHIGVHYSELIAPLIKSTQEMITLVENRESKIAFLKQRIASINS